MRNGKCLTIWQRPAPGHCIFNGAVGVRHRLVGFRGGLLWRASIALFASLSLGPLLVGAAMWSIGFFKIRKSGPSWETGRTWPTKLNCIRTPAEWPGVFRMVVVMGGTEL